MLFDRKIDVPRDWELHLVDIKDHYGKGDHKYLTHNESFAEVCKERYIRGNIDTIKVMVERTQVDLEARDREDRTPLHWAALFGHLPALQYLCEQGADKDARGDHDLTPLHWVAYRGRLPVVQYLCEQGVDKEARSRGGITPMHKAADYGHLPVVQYLCMQGADKEVRSNIGRTPLHSAAYRGRLPVVQYLCEQGVDKEARSRGGFTPLQFARGADDEYLDVSDEEEDEKQHRLDGRLLIIKYLSEQV